MNYKLIETHTLKGKPTGIWLLLDEGGEPVTLPDGLMLGWIVESDYMRATKKASRIIEVAQTVWDRA